MYARSSLGLAAAVIVLLWAGAAPALAVDDLVVAKSTVAAERDSDGKVTATINVTNNGEAVTLKPPANAIGRTDCTVDVDPVTIPERQGTSVTLTLGGTCFDPGATAHADVQFELDDQGSGVPTIVIKPPTSVSSPWRALVIGGAFGAVLAAVFYTRTQKSHVKVQKDKVPGRADPGYERYSTSRKDAYAKVQALVRDPWARISGEPLQWEESLPPRTYGRDDPVGGLEATWSLKDSWMASLTAVISAVVAIGTSDKLFTALGADQPKGPLGVMAIAGLIGIALVAAATTLVKLIGKPANDVTVQGLLVSNAILLGAATFEVAAVTIAAGYALNAWDELVKFIWLILLGIALIALAWWYLSEKMIQTIDKGVPVSGVPAIPVDELEKWMLAPVGGAPDLAIIAKKAQLEQRVKTALAPWLAEASKPKVLIGTAWEATGMAAGAVDWGPGEDDSSSSERKRQSGLM